MKRRWDWCSCGWKILSGRDAARLRRRLDRNSNVRRRKRWTELKRYRRRAWYAFVEKKCGQGYAAMLHESLRQGPDFP